VRATQLAAFAVEQRAGLLDLWAVYEQVRARGPDTALEAALREPEWAPALRAHTVHQLTAQAERTRVLLRNAIVDGDWPPYVEHTRTLGARSAALGASLSSWSVVIRGVQRRLIPALVEAYAATPARLTAAIAAMTELIELSTSLVAEPYAGPQHGADAHKRLQVAFEHRTLELEDANRALDAFSYSVAHDLRAPLRAMNGFAQILLEDHAFRLEPEAVAYLRKIQGNAMRMGVLIDALLGLSRLSRSTLQIQQVDLSALARGVASQLAAAEPKRAVDVTIEPGLTAMADPRLARSVFDNLLGNAWKFTARSPAPKIAVGSADGRTFFVRDNGVGFDMEHAGKLFAPFERMHTVDEFPGTGIGLAIVKRIVQRHGGRISVTAQLAAGATFFFTLSSAG
jgi:signal transduction histidine kinase